MSAITRPARTVSSGVMADSLSHFTDRPAFSNASASRRAATICSGLRRFRLLIESLLAHPGSRDSHDAWVKFWGAGQGV
jgi:hypothetical protein